MSGNSLFGHVGSMVRRLGMLGSLRRTLSVLRREGWRAVMRKVRRPPIPEAESANGITVIGSARRLVTAHGANLVGHPYGALGMGEHIRKSAHAFAAADVPFVIVNTFNQVGSHGDKFPEFPFASRITSTNPHPVSLFHLNADEMALASAHLGEAFFANRYNIGYWAWELAKFPDAWARSFDYFDEIWAPSRFIQQAVAEKSPVPVIFMPLAVGSLASEQLPRRHFGLPEDRFLFLFYFDFTSYMSRKNPLATIAAFDLAFPRGSRRNVGLVIKLNGMEQKPLDYQRFLAALDNRDDATILIDRVMTDQEVRNLVQGCDCFVSLHRSEGFGRGMAEAMYYGKPVIATGYSGNLDFMHNDNACVVDHVLIPVKDGEYPHSEGQFWADPDIEQAAGYMRAMVADPALARRLGERAAEFIRTHHGFEAVGARYRKRLARLGFLVS